ncbi:class I SAM-dependent methyltransferase [Planktomarina temperata]|nr:class I SAM-dependent methyltransferase [Planktomarina temperata]
MQNSIIRRILSFKTLLGSSFLHRRELERLIIKHSHHCSGQILDFGCGDMPYRKHFTFKNYIGLDTVNSENSCADMLYDKLPLPIVNDSIDSILCTQVLYQIKDDSEVLSDMYRIIKPGGKLVLSVPFMWFDADTNASHRYSLNTISEKVTKAGFTIIEKEKVCNNFGLFFCLYLKYIDRILNTKRPTALRLFLTRVIRLSLFLGLNLLGMLFSCYGAKRSDFYSDNFIIAVKN